MSHLQEGMWYRLQRELRLNRLFHDSFIAPVGYPLRIKLKTCGLYLWEDMRGNEAWVEADEIWHYFSPTTPSPLLLLASCADQDGTS